MKIVEYKIIKMEHSGEEEIVSENLNKHIKEGWQPYGSPFIEEEGYGEILQAIVKYKKED